MSTYLFAQETSIWSGIFPMLQTVLFVVVVLVLPFIVGWLLAQWLRMRDYAWKFGLILWSIVVASTIIGGTWNPSLRRFQIPLGVDLQGGVILIYEVDKEASSRLVDDTRPKSDVGPEAVEVADGQYSMSALIEALSRRINPSGTKEIVVRPYGLGQVEIIVPEVDDRAVDQIKKVISTAGVLQFRIVANSRKHRDVIDLAREMAADPVKKRGRYVRDDGGHDVGLWARVAREQFAIDGVRPFKVAVGDYTLRDPSTGALLNVPPDVTNNPADRSDDSRRLRLARWVADQGLQEIDVLMFVGDGLNVNGSHLGSVSKSTDEVMQPCILFSLKGPGVGLFAELSGQNAPDEDGFHSQLGIVLDNELLSAPNIQEQITGSGRITGRFTEEEVEFLVNILEAGSLPVVLNPDPISENLISPLLGRETIIQGQWAMVVATVLVFLFMLVYYRFAGLLACLALVINILLTVAIMVLIKAPLTMPGLAGLVLTVGMSVDANVLIFERIREELNRGAALRMAVRNGFSRATATIIDANVTTILTAVILYWIGTDQLRGFAVTLILGILTSMFTAIFCARAAFDVVDRLRWLTSLRMGQFLGVTHLDFLAKRHLAVGLSSIVIGLGLIGAIVRGQDLFDIDFTGGSSVHVTIDRPADAEEVRAIVDKKFAAVGVPYTLTGMSAVAGQATSSTFKVDAKLEKVEDLERLISEAFEESQGDLRLATYSLSYGPLKAITTAASGSAISAAGSRGSGVTAEAEPTVSPTPKSGTSAPSPQPPLGGEKGTEGKPSEPARPAAPQSAETSKPSAVKTDEAKSTEPKSDAPKSEEPKSDKGASTVLPADTLLALAVQDVGTAPQTQPASGESKPAASPEGGTPAAPGGASPAGTTSGTVPASSPAAGVPAEPAVPTGVVQQIEVLLEFGHEINEPTLRSEIERAAEATGIPLSYFDLSNPKWQGGSNAFEAWTLRIPTTEAETQKLLGWLKDHFQNAPVWSSSNKIGPQVAGRMQRTAIVALVASWLGIIVYVWIRFQNLVFGLAAVIALVHDVLVTVAAIALSHWLAGALGFLLVEDFKISLTIVAALLTIVGYSINDTIVIFDRLREVKGKSPEITAEMINLSLNQTLSRTILTAFTVFIVVIVLYGFGGQGIHGFAFSLLVGVISGSYSTIYIASPFVLWLAGKSAEARPKSAAA